MAKLNQILRLRDERNRQLAVNTLKHLSQAVDTRRGDNDRGRTEHFLLKDLVAFNQQFFGCGKKLGLSLQCGLVAPSQMANALGSAQTLDTGGVGCQRAGIEHGLRRLLGQLVAQGDHEIRKLWGFDSDNQTWVGAELAAPHYHRISQLTGHLLRPGLQGSWQDYHRVDTRHFGENRNGLRAGRRQITQGASTFQRSGKPNRLDGRMFY
ncbi:hypothetical protein D3C75_456090 [compost metagenome]